MATAGFAKTRAADGTQSFVGTLSAVWSRPSLLGLELLWRWTYGIPALALLGLEAHKVLLAATSGTLDPAGLGLPAALMADPVGSLAGDPLGAAGHFATALGRLTPGLQAVAAWMAPLLFAAWIVASSIGRTAMLRRADPDLRRRPLLLMAFHALRIGAIAVMGFAWYAAVAWASRTAILAPIAIGAEPNLVLYCALVIVSTLGLFTLWGFLGWLLSLAPLIAMAQGTSFAGSLRAAGGMRELRRNLVEINLVMSIVKIALIVLAMVFTATPLPFESIATAQFLFWWWIGVMLVYVLWSDFFHVARLIAYLHLYRRALEPIEASQR